MLKKIIKESIGRSSGLSNDSIVLAFQAEMAEISKKYSIKMFKSESILRIISELTKLVVSKTDINDIMTYILENAKIHLRATAGTFYRVEGDRLVFSFISGGSSELKNGELPINTSSIAGFVAVQKTPLIVNNPALDYRFNSSFDKKSKSGFTTENILCLPVMFNGRLYGVIQLLNKRDNVNCPVDFTEEDGKGLELFANIAAMAIDNRNQVEQLTKTVAKQAAIEI
ncbi:MAG: GAF domain-containing protein, partial [Candidatus Margulisiibacteriota bacterium]